MKLLIKYVWSNRRTIFYLLAFSAIFAVLAMVYDVPAGTAGYGFLLCSAVALIGGGVGFLRFRGKYELLREMAANLPLLPDELPSADTLSEEELYSLLTRSVEIGSANLTRLNEIQQNNSDYFTVWVHQIKTPISAMRMLLQTEDSDISRELTAELFRVEQYAEMALQYIRLDSTSDDLLIRSYDIDGIIRQAVRRYAPLFIRRHISLKFEPVEGNVITDEKWLLFVIEQLLSNGVKYTARGSVTVGFEDNCLFVRDTGIGISPEDLPRIFEKGYTGLSGRRDKKSTGLGLYLCKRVCDKLGHKISAASEVGKGTEFRIDLSRDDFDIE